MQRSGWWGLYKTSIGPQIWCSYRGNEENMNKFALLGFGLALLGALAIPRPVAAETAEWALDGSHSRIGFSVSHMVVSSVSGRFKQFSGKIELDDADPTKSHVDISIKTESIDTDEAKRDEHLRSPDFFDAKKFPTLSFKSTKIAKAGGKKYKLSGDLTIHGITKAVTLDAELSEAVKSPWGKMVRSVKLGGKVKRGDFGLKWNKTLDAGGVVVGEDVTLDIQVEINK
jgi:polyisoprenoid-binding protein YceI